MTGWRRANFQTSLERNYSSPLVCSINQRQAVVVAVAFYPSIMKRTVLVVQNLPASAGNIRDMDSFPGLGRSKRNFNKCILAGSETFKFLAVTLLQKEFLWEESKGGNTGNKERI